MKQRVRTFQQLLALPVLRPSITQRTPIFLQSPLSRPLTLSFPLFSTAPDEKELAQARNWLKTFDQHKIPRTVGEVTFSRSSGPGGQNVNKVNSKATLRVPIRKLESLVPEIFIKGLKKNTRYLANDDREIVISSDSSRSQLKNTDECWQKLYDVIVNSTQIPGETSVEQKERVKKLDKAYNERRLKEKHKASSKKAARRGGSGEW